MTTAAYYLTVAAGGLNDLFSGDDGADDFPANPVGGTGAIVSILLVVFLALSIWRATG